MSIPFIDRRGRRGTVFVTAEPATNFGTRIDAEEAARLLRNHGNYLPFTIMAAGYGDDEDWVGLDTSDLDSTGSLTDPEGWAPYELWWHL